MAKKIIFESGYWTITEKIIPYNLNDVDGYRIAVDLCQKGNMIKKSEFFISAIEGTEEEIKKRIQEVIPVLFKSLEHTANKLKEGFYNTPVSL